jgi:hypothetical protein
MIVSAQNDSTYEYEAESVQIRLDREYVRMCHEATPVYSRAAAHFCQGARELGYDECEFFLPGIPVLCRIALIKAFKVYGIKLDWEEAEDEDGEEGIVFYADLSEMEI